MYLPRKLVGHRATQAIAADEIGPVWLDRAHLFDVMTGHVFEPGVGSLPAIEAHSLDSIERLVGAQLSCQVAKQQDVTAMTVDQEEWRFRTGGLDLHQRRPS